MPLFMRCRRWVHSQLSLAPSPDRLVPIFVVAGLHRMPPATKAKEILREPYQGSTGPDGSYKELEKVGEGAFGEVFLAMDVHSGGFVALKRIHLTNLSKDGIPKAALREMRALHQLRHEHVVELRDVFPHGSALVLVMEYMVSDLSEVISRAESLLPPSHIKSYMWMLLQGVEAMHSRCIIHRDLKPSNLLLSSSGVLKIGDFGLARVIREPQPESYSHQVATRWYRAPELLFGSRHYGLSVDLWAVGAIFGELCTLNPLFPGRSDMDQAFRVLQVLGTPTDETWPTANELPDYSKVVFPDMPPLDLAETYPSISTQAMPLLRRLLVLDPARRVPASKALKDEYFFHAPLPAEPAELQVPKRQLRSQKHKST